MRAALAVLLLLASPALAQQPPPVDGPGVPFTGDALAEKLAGKWDLRGTIMGETVQQKLEAKWVLNHQFLQLHFEGVPDPKKKNEPDYEALVYLGMDNLSERYVCHWIDVFGGRASEALGFAPKATDAIRLSFEGADGPFNTTFTWNAAKGSWGVTMRQKDKAGKWMSFAEMTGTRVAPAAKQ